MKERININIYLSRLFLSRLRVRRAGRREWFSPSNNRMRIVSRNSINGQPIIQLQHYTVIVVYLAANNYANPPAVYHSPHEQSSGCRIAVELHSTSLDAADR